MTEKKLTMKRVLEVEIPMIPNFIKAGKDWVSISDFSDEELRSLGKEWTEKLIRNAKNKRSIKL